MKNRIYLLTGAAGFLGSNICSQLIERGDKVRAFVLSGDPAVKYIPKGVEICEGNLCSEEDCDRFFTVPENTETICIHCASMVTVNPDYSEKLMAVNVGGTENIIKAAENHPECYKLVYVSSTGAIPELPKGQVIKEVTRFDPYDEKKVVGWYSRSKAIATQKVLDAAARGLNACVVHPSGILGPNDHAISETTGTIIKIMNGEMPVGMGGSFNLCDVRDLAYGTIAACDKGRKGECYILGNKEVTLKEVAKMLHDACGCKQPMFYVPIALAYKLAAQMEKKAEKTGEKPLMTNFAVYNLDRNNCFDYSKAERELGYHTRPYAETLRDEARWLVAEGKIKGNVKVLDEPVTEKAEPAVNVATQVRTTMEDRDFIIKVAAAENEDQLRALLDRAGITGYDDDSLRMALRSLTVSRNASELTKLFKEKNYYRCSNELSKLDVETTPAEFDLINDIFSCAGDASMARDMAGVNDHKKAAVILKKYGYYHITEDVLSVILQYASMLDQQNVFTESDYSSMEKQDFNTRCMKNLSTICAIGVITALKYGVHNSYEIPYMIAIAGGVTLIKKRFVA
ncbi:MAG: NAD-dependent epimerase/dehydratase family protein [Sphaerochaetaceae bacterium]|nr:NAD-dependent epimerase/dehydratase family protein [Sphaerochaetaceae bacterium]